MIAHPRMREEIFSLTSTPAIVADALTRIPSDHFLDMAWAKDSIATCASMLADAARGDVAHVSRWVHAADKCTDIRPLVSVLHAVCDAIVADAFRSRGDTSGVSAFVASVEGDVLGRLAANARRKEAAIMADPVTAQVAGGLVRIVQMHDEQTAVHLDATAALARRIAIVMKLPTTRVAIVELAARLHDIGKVSVPKDILCKPGPLSAAEWHVMRGHVTAGAEALAQTPGFMHLAPIVRAQHERMDGTGYPDRLGAAEIPLESRIVAVADAFHAMTTERSYRRAMMPGDAIDLLAENAGTQFDVDVVAATFELFRCMQRAQRAIA